MGLELYRRHLKNCKYAGKGAGYTKCSCPIWAYGRLPGVARPVRKSVGLRDWARAVRRVEQWEEKPETVAAERTIGDCIASYLDDCRARGLAASTVISYRNTLAGLQTWCSRREIVALDAITLECLTDFRAAI